MDLLIVTNQVAYQSIHHLSFQVASQFMLHFMLNFSKSHIKTVLHCSWAQGNLYKSHDGGAFKDTLRTNSHVARGAYVSLKKLSDIRASISVLECLLYQSEKVFLHENRN